MSNYPPTPSFGGPFNYNPHFAPPPNGSLNMMAQPGYSQPRDSMFPPQGPPHHYSVQYPNTYAFNTNAQHLNVSLPGNGIAPSPSFSTYGQYTNGSLPPPPFPPIPIPNYAALPQHQAVLEKPALNPRALQPHLSLPPKPVSQTRAVETVDLDLGNGNTLALTTKDLEDGELSDGEKNKETMQNSLAALQSPQRASRHDDMYNSRLGQKIAMTEDQEVTSENRSESRLGKASFQHPRTGYQRSTAFQNTSNNTPRQVSGNQSPTSNSVGLNIVQQNNSGIPPHPIASSLHGNIGDFNESSMSKKRNNSSAMLTMDLQRRSSFDRPPQDSVSQHDYVDHTGFAKTRRELAKQSLLEIDSCGFGFEKLVAEGIAPTTLKDLYPEIGLQIPLFSSSPKPQLDTPPTANEKSQSRATSAVPDPSLAGDGHAHKENTNSESQPPKATLDNTEIGQGTRGTTEQKGVSVGVIVDSSASILHPDMQRNGQPDSTPSTPIAAPSVGPKSSGTAKKTITGLASDKALERKDYIAKMLAAKTGKNVALNKVSQPSRTSTSAAEKANTAVLADRRSASMEISDKSASASFPVDKETDLEAKRKAQTELARQKMEALKHRGSMHVDESPKALEYSEPMDIDSPDLAPSTQAEAAMHEEPVSHSQQVSSTVHVQPAEELTTASTPTALYTPLSSSFSSVGRKPSSGIPGLFMSAAPAPHFFGIQGASVPHAESPPQLAPSVSAIQSPSQSSQPAPDAITQASATANVNESVDPPSVSNHHIPTQPVNENGATSGLRKRATAADFIDLPSARVKRRLGSSGNTQVVIEVSDDEAEAAGNDDIQLNKDVQAEIPHQNGSLVNESVQVKAINDIPPLSDVTSRMKPSIASSVNTPPSAQTPSKGREQEDLKRKEEQIHLMQRRIAELEQKRKAKQTTSRAHTPGTPSRSGPIAHVDTSPGQTNQQLQFNHGVEQSLETANEQLEAQVRSLDAAETELENKLEVEEQAKVTEVLRAEAMRVESMEATIIADIRHRHARRVELEVGLPQLDTAVQKARSELESLRTQEARLEAEIRAGLQGRQAIVEELESLAVLEQEYSSSKAIEPSKLTDQKMINSTESVSRSSISVDSDDTNSRRTIIRIRTDSPVTASAELSHSSHEQLQSAEVDGDVVETSGGFSDEGEITNHLLDNATDSVLTSEPSVRGIQEYEPTLEINLPMEDAVEASTSERSEDIKMTEDFAPDPAQLAPVTDSNGGFTPEESQGRRKDPEYADSQEEGEVSRSISNASDSDDYEPPEPRLAVDNRAESVESEPFSPKSPIPPLSDQAPTQLHSPSFFAPGAEDTTAGTALELNQPNDQVLLTAVQNYREGHFTPYESPLKQFNSYRYNPNYLSDVPGGFRSLTFSHNINPNKPICRWELAGGTCNDDSCDSQHFRSMGLSDDMVLVQMGSVHEGTTPAEKDAYVAGLKQIIQEMRGRKVKDFNTVASEITSYRRRFLGDPSRFLTL